MNHKEEKQANIIGIWAFAVGIVFAFIAGAFGLLSKASQNKELFAVLLVFLGIIVGFFNVHKNERKSFITTGTALVIVIYFGQAVLEFVPWLQSILWALLILFVPAIIVVALKELFSLAHQ